jgi:formate hydrogenlyase subunit 3/multisubunit Na+/H+ antiporter MnhD subunit
MARIDWILAIVCGWFVIAAWALLAMHRTKFVARRLFPLGAILALALAVLSVGAVFEAPEGTILAIGLPGLPFHLRLDALSSFFLAVLGAGAAGISVFSAGYFRAGEGTPPGLLCFEYHVFLAAMALVLLADDAYCFMVMWETMALSSFLLVNSNHRSPAIRRAAYLYLLLAHIGAIALLLCFGVMQSGTGDYTFAHLRAADLSPAWGSVAFVLALLGFGAKAGAVPLHVWLPEAHPAAPSPVSALLSAIMLKTAIYGLLRVAFDLLHAGQWWWGVALLLTGTVTALLGVVFSTVQTEMKRLLAYSSIENIGLILIALGLALVFRAYGMVALSALALTAALFHVVAHAFFKSLLFLGTGSVLHSTGERNLGRLGGLIHRMPRVAWLMLVGALAGAGLPPFAGFVSEWLLLQSFLFTTALPGSFLDMLIPLVSAVVALVAALAGYTMVKFYGVVFLGRPREERLAGAHDAPALQWVALAWFAAGCIALGLAPLPLIELIDRVTQELVGDGVAQIVRKGGWLLLAPVGLERASYGPLIFLAGVLAAISIGWLIVHHHRRLGRGSGERAGMTWACGGPEPGARMQDSAEGFGQPIRQIFEPLFRMRRELPSPFDERPRYEVTIEDHLWYRLYLPVAAVVDDLARRVGALQQGRISIYLLYSFLTLLVLLLVVRW